MWRKCKFRCHNGISIPIEFIQEDVFDVDCSNEIDEEICMNFRDMECFVRDSCYNHFCEIDYVKCQCFYFVCGNRRWNDLELFSAFTDRMLFTVSDCRNLRMETLPFAYINDSDLWYEFFLLNIPCLWITKELSLLTVLIIY